MEVFKLLMAPLMPFVGHPERAWMVAALLAIVLILTTRLRTFRARHHVPLLLATIAWGGFGFLEQQAVAHGWNIRVDLLLIGPFLLAISAWAAWAGYRLAVGPGAGGGGTDHLSNGGGTDRRPPGESAVP